MFSIGVVAFLVAAGIGTWVYTKMQHKNGGTTQYSIIVAGVAGFFVFITVLFFGRFLQ